MLETAVNVVNYSIPFFVVCMAIEGIAGFYWFGRKVYDRNDTFASLASGVGSVLVSLLVKGGIFGIMQTIYAASPLSLGHEWWVWVLCFVTFDFLFYFAHRFGHEVRIGWAAHIPHHSSRKYNLATALRQSWTHHYLFIFYTPLAALGFDPIMILIVNSVNTVYQFWIHTELVGKLGPLEWVLNTPSHHRVHHGSNPQYLDKNYAGAFIVWDRIFGTFVEEKQKVVYGLTKNIGSYNPVFVNFHEWRDMFRDVATAKSWKNKIKHIFLAPAWKPEEHKNS